MSRLYNRPVQAIKEPNKAGAATRKATRMVMDNKAHSDKQTEKKKQFVRGKKMATKNDRRADTGARARKADTGGRRTDTAKSRTAKLKAHFKKILTGKTGRMQGKK